jgi:hypothetical protein
VEDFGRVLMREARAPGVADCVRRHSASLTGLARSGNWARVRQELVATQADVEQAILDLRDEKMAHLISLIRAAVGRDLHDAGKSADELSFVDVHAIPAKTGAANDAIREVY